MRNCFDNNLDVYFKNIENYCHENFNSVIFELFYFIYNSKVKRFNCNIISSKIHIDKLFTFSLDEIKEIKDKDKNIITINDCFSFFSED